MNRLIIGLLLWVGTGNLLSAQQVENKTFKWSKGQKLVFNLKFGDSIQVEGWNKPTVGFKAIYQINEGEDNEILEFNYSENGDRLEVIVDFDEKLVKELQKRQLKNEDCPGFHIKSDISYVLFVPKEADLSIESISADIIAKELNGELDLKTISGFVDLDWPDSKGANFSMKTVTGEVYSGLKIDFSNLKEKQPIVGYNLLGELNRGGSNVRLNSISNNIYVR
ncbi:hypothetical protein E1171_00815 [Cytophagales bacterium RKSG123]|nr:hypothetical protein [Xanthovirga aplysinae]